MRRLLCGALVVSGMLYTLSARADDAKAIIEKGIAAVGGADKIGKTKALTWKGKGTVNIMGNTIEFSGDWFIQPPKQMKNQIDVDFGGNKTTITTVLNGDKGWRSFMGQTMDLDDDSLAEAKEELYAGRVGQLVPLVSDTGFKFTSLGDSKVGDQAVAGVKVSHEGHRDISLFFDKNTGLLVKSSRRAKDQMSGQEVDQDTLVGDYKDVDGVKHYTKMTIKRDGSDFIQMQISDYKTPESLPANTFDKPGQ